MPYYLQHMETPPIPRAEPALHREVGGTLWRFLTGRALIAIILTVVHLLAFWVVDLPWWGLSGVVVGSLTLVPFLGFFAGAAAALLITVLAGGGWGDVVALLVVMTLAQILEGAYLTPRILGRELNLHPALVFLAIIVGSLTFGPLGAFLAAPLAAVLALVWRRRKPAAT